MLYIFANRLKFLTYEKNFESSSSSTWVAGVALTACNTNKTTEEANSNVNGICGHKPQEVHINIDDADSGIANFTDKTTNGTWKGSFVKVDSLTWIIRCDQ